MQRAQPSKERQDLGFPAIVISAFEFLVKDFSFSCVKRDATYVRYESSAAFVNIYHGRASFELNVEIGERVVDGRVPENSFTIGDILYFVNPQIAEDYRPYQVTNTESVRKFVNELAHLVKDYATPALQGDHAFLQRVSEIQLQRSDNLVRGWELNRVRKDVEIAWRDKDFKRVIQLFEPFEKYLTPAEVKKLEFAKKKIE
jgi:hypothetical protein